MKKKTSFPQWKGFEKSPEGCLLEQTIDLDGEMGFAYERCCEYYKDFHTHDRLMFIFPRGSSSMEVRTKAPAATFKVDAFSILLVPRDLVHDDEGTASIYDTVALYPSEELLVAAAKRLGLSHQQMSSVKMDCKKIIRSEKIDRYIQEYFFDRVLSGKSADNEDVVYVARRILDEILCIVFPECRRESKVMTVASDESMVTTALRFIEANLFQELSLDLIAKASGASSSTLLRKFKDELKSTPVAYVKNRRLEEAHRLLSGGGRSVSEVAILVGYENFGAFSEAFKAKFRVPPSKVRSG